MARIYDTLNNVDISNAKGITDIYELVMGIAMQATDLCGVVTTGPVECNVCESESWGGREVKFGEHTELWSIRSSPAGRIGKPLIPDEVRKVSVRIRTSATSNKCTITNIKIWKLPSSDKLVSASSDLFRAKEGHQDRGCLTYGASGVGMYGINLFEQRATVSSTFLSSNGCQTVLSAIATTVLKKKSMCKIEASLASHYVVSSSLAGIAMSAPCMKKCEEQYTEEAWKQACSHNALHFHQLVLKSPYAKSKEASIQLFYTAGDIFDQISQVGYLDMRADKFFSESLQDDMRKPSGMALMIAISVRIACLPGMWGLLPTHSDDALATKEASLFVESIIPSVVALGKDGVGGEQMFSIDVVINHAQAYLVANTSAPNYNTVEKSMKETMHFLFCAGVAVCIDVFGMRPKLRDGSSGTYNRYGMASQLVDSVVESRAQSAYDSGMGNIVDRWPTLRTSSRGRRQLALASVFVEVDEWLKTGKHRGSVLTPPTPESEGKPLPTTAPPSSVYGNTASKSTKKTKKPRATGSTFESSTKSFSGGTNAAVRSMFSSTSRNDKHIAACSAKLCGAAVNRASDTFVQILQQGGCAGMTTQFDVTSYVVSPTSRLKCAHCENMVNVVQSVAFSGLMGNCKTCRHPRCLDCVSRGVMLASDSHFAEQLENCFYCIG